MWKKKCEKCGSTPADTNIMFHRFPKITGERSELKCRIWAEYVYGERPWTLDSLTDLYKTHKFVCCKHFSEDSYTNGTMKKMRQFAIPIGTRHILERCRNPILACNSFNEVIEEKQLTPMILPAVPDSLNEETAENNQSKQKGVLKPLNLQQIQQLSPREKKIYKKCRNQLSEICKLRRKLRLLKGNKMNYLKTLAGNTNLKKIINHKLSGSFCILLQSQLTNCPRPRRGRRWSTDDKTLALSIYKKSPACYRLLTRLFCLPSPGTLKGFLNRVPMTCGINEHLLNALQELPDDVNHRSCVLTFDEMSIRKNVYYNPKSDQIEGYEDHGSNRRSPVIASNALVFMLAGLRKRWKQPVAYYFCGDAANAYFLKNVILEVIEKCLQSGLQIVATCCDLNGVNIKALNMLGSSNEKPWLSILGKDIVTILDPPHLLKCFRNLFLKYNVDCPLELQSGGRGIAEWSHIKAFYERDHVNQFVFAPALTRQHLDPNGQQKMRVKLAAQVLSHTVAAGIYAKVSNNELPPTATTTASLISRMDNLFDSLNADSPSPKRGKVYSRNLSENSPHIKFIEECKTYISSIKFIGIRSNPPSLDGWIRTLNAVLKLWSLLKVKGIKTLATRRLNQDPLENCFGCIRTHCGSNPNPTVTQFTAGLKTAILNNLMHTGQKKNCEEDGNSLLNDLKKYFETAQCGAPSNHANIDLVHTAEAADIDINSFEGTSEAQACAYVSGFIIKNLGNNNCDTCKSNMLSSSVGRNHVFTTFKEYHQTKTSLTYAHDQITILVEACARNINEHLKKNPQAASLKSKLLSSIIENVDFGWLDGCTDHCEQNKFFLIKSTMAVCIKRFCVLQNRRFVEEASKKALKRKLALVKNI